MDFVQVTFVHGCTRLMFPSPVVTLGTLQELARRIHELAADAASNALVLASGHPRIFLAGADLSEVALLDLYSSVAYASAGRRAAATLRSYPAPTVAAVTGSCSGGGFDLVLACDVVIASPDATFAHPGVMRGLVTGWGGTVDLPPRLGRAATRRALLEGGQLTTRQLAEAGVVHAVTEDPVADACELAHRLADLHPSRLPLWRSLRLGIDRALLRTIPTRGIID